MGVDDHACVVMYCGVRVLIFFMSLYDAVSSFFFLLNVNCLWRVSFFGIVLIGMGWGFCDC